MTSFGRRAALILSAVALVGAAACGTEPSTRAGDGATTSATPTAGAPATTAAPTAPAVTDAGSATVAPTATPATTVGAASTPVESVPAPTVPPGTTLRVGDQLDYLKTVLELAGQDDDLPYDLEYANFVGGPPMLQAFQGGALDAGFVASTPILFAQAAGQDLTAVAGWATDRGSGALISADPAIRGWADLAGKRVAFQRGTSAQASLLVGLAGVGLGLDDITIVDVNYVQVTAALASGSADAGISAEPLVSAYILEHPDTRVVEQPGDITDAGSFLIATPDALADPAKEAAVADYAVRLARSFAYLRANPDLVIQLYADRYGLTVERATAIHEAAGPTRFLTLPDDIVDAQQTLADLFVEAGELPESIDVAQEFDGRFAAIIAAAGAGA